MPKLKILSGKEVIKIFAIFGFCHVKLQRIKTGKQTLTIPNHTELDKGTLKAIYNQALRYISEDDLRKYFYSE